MINIDLNTFFSKNYCASMKSCIDPTKCDLYYEPEIISDNEPDHFGNFKEKISKMTQEQMQFFINFINPRNRFVFYPIKISSIIDFEYEKADFFAKDKSLIFKWIFSITCGLYILAKNSIDTQILPISIFLDSKLEARISNLAKDITEESTKISEYYYYKQPEYFNKDGKYENQEKTIDLEKKYVFWLALLMINLLNSGCLNSHLQILKNKSKKEWEEQQYQIVTKCIPKCSLQDIICKSLSKNPSERPLLSKIIYFLLQEENCLDGVDYHEFKKWVIGKFNIKSDVNVNKLFGEILKILAKKIRDNSNNNNIEPFKLSDIPNFINLARDTSFGKAIKRECELILENCRNILPEHLKTMYDDLKTEDNKYEIMELCIKRIVNNNLDIFSKCLSLFTIDNMSNNHSFDIKIYEKSQSIIFVLNKNISINPDYSKNFNNDPLFVHCYYHKYPYEMTFYPFLNIYNLLYNNISTKKISFDDKIRWLLQVSKALSIIHINDYTLESFNSQDVFIDENFNAHLSTFKLINCKTNFIDFEIEFSDENNYNNSYLAPEIISSGFNNVSNEKSLVYSFGVFILELFFEVQPGSYLNNLSQKEKYKLLLKKRKCPVKTGRKEDDLIPLLESCLNINPVQRKSFKEISEIISKKYQNIILHTNQINDFKFNELENVYKKGSLISQRIYDSVYHKLNSKQKFELDSNLANNNLNYISKFDLIWKVLNNERIVFISNHNCYVNNNKKISFQVIDKTDSQNIKCKNLSASRINKIDEYIKSQKKVWHNYCHLNGLRKKSSRQLVLRIGENYNDDYKRQIEFIVKNSNYQPFGDNLKIKNVQLMIQEYIRKGFFDKDIRINKESNGNITIYRP